MWKNYSLGYLKHNRASGISVMLAAFISALLLSLLCSLFYNFWAYEIQRIESEEGAWHGRIAGELNETDLRMLKNFASVKTVTVNEELSKGGELAEDRELSEVKELTVDICFGNIRNTLSDMPRLAELTGLPQEAVSYHYSLLNMYLIRAPHDTAPRLLFPFVVGVVVLACASLILIIRHSFAVSMQARIHQFGIFSSIGATPAQIRMCLLQEAVALCLLPVLVGNLLGIGISIWLIGQIDVLAGDVAGRMEAVWTYHPLVFAGTFGITAVTVWISAWIPARKMSRLTPMEAIKNTEDLKLKRKKHSRILYLLFGVEGELAGNALKAQKKAMRTAALSLQFSFLAFTLVMCFFSLSMISQRMTYFEKYQDAWDIMVTVRETGIDEIIRARADTGNKETVRKTKTDEELQFESGKATEGNEESRVSDIVGEIRALDDIESVVAYQKTRTKTPVSEEEISEAFASMGGFEAASEKYVTKTDGGWLVNAPIVIMDDVSFLAYCEQAGADARLDGAIVRNQICDFTDPNFRSRAQYDYLTGQQGTRILGQTIGLQASEGFRAAQEGINEQQAVQRDLREAQKGTDTQKTVQENLREEQKGTDAQQAVQEGEAEIQILAYSSEVPALREEYGTLDYFELVHFLPASLWEEIKEQITGGDGEKGDTFIRVLACDPVTPESLAALQAEIQKIAGVQDLEILIENRVQDKINNDNMYHGMMLILGGFCVLLAGIGIGSVFANTLGFVRQRKREFARYLSIGLTPEGLRKMFCIEVLVLAGKPVLVTVPLAAVFVALMLKASYLEPAVFIREAPFVPIAAFILAIFGFVAFAYFISWQRVKKISLADALRDDTMV